MSNETFQILELHEPPVDGELGGELVGYAVHKIGTTVLDTHLWPEYDYTTLRDHITDRNNQEMLKEHWPNANDAEVTALVTDPDFEPLEYVEEEQVADYGELGEQVERGEVRLEFHEETGEHSIHPDDQSKVRTVSAKVLKDASAPMKRYQAACEAVARDRLEAAHATDTD